MATLSISVLKHQQKDNGSYPVNISVSHKGETAYIQTGYYAEKHQIQVVKGKKSKLEIKDRYLLTEVLNVISSYDKELRNMTDLDNYTAKKIKEYLEFRVNAEKKRGSEVLLDFLSFARGYVKEMKQQGRNKPAANYNTLINSLQDYLQRDFMYTKEINKNFLSKFSEYIQSERTITRKDQFGILRQRKVSGGEITVYNRLKDLKTLFYAMKSEYNKEDEDYIPIPHNPFKGFKLSQPETEPRGLTMAEIVNMYRFFDTGETTREKLGLDLFFLSFFLVGMNAVDFYEIGKESLKKGRISYNRAKTKTRRKDKALISIKVEPIALNLMEKYLETDKSSPHLFTFHKIYSCPDNFTRAINEGLESICKKNDVPVVTLYVARHSWATIARNECGISKDDITLALNHKSADKTERVTDIYLKKDWSLIDKANQKVIAYLQELL